MSEAENKIGIDWMAGLYWVAATVVALEMVVLILYAAFKAGFFD